MAEDGLKGCTEFEQANVKELWDVYCDPAQHDENGANALLSATSAEFEKLFRKEKELDAMARVSQRVAKQVVSATACASSSATTPPPIEYGGAGGAGGGTKRARKAPAVAGALVLQ